MAVEAIIISGPRRGDVITVQDDMTIAPPEQVVEALNDALKKLDAAIVSVIEETRAWRAALRNEGKDPAHG